jgi:hypothetical protein
MVRHCIDREEGPFIQQVSLIGHGYIWRKRRGEGSERIERGREVVSK